ncbi:MAG: DUF2142 domain-containing protein [Xanthobacteraceae bacterium]
MLFGAAIIAITAPLRGPDEAAHFLRAYGIAQGDLVPSQADGMKRKGVFLPARLHREFALFEAAHATERRMHWSREAHAASAPQRIDSGVEDIEPAFLFVAYEGSEGYTPIVYLPHALAAFVAHRAGLGFVDTLFVMRLTGLAALTAVIAAAIAIVPYFRWAFLCIAMLPAALYGRAVISADGAALACAMMVTAATLQGALRVGTRGWGQQALWMTLAALSKPPVIVFALLAPMRWSLEDLSRRWRMIAGVIVPGLVAMAAWTALTSGDIAAWRMAELTGRDAEQFAPAWKLAFMLQQPLHFPTTLMGALQSTGELWLQLIGVLGLLDTVLQPWTYPAITALLAAACMTPMDIGSAQRRPIAALAGLTAAAYVLAVFLIFYLTSTPTDAEQVWGVQGRYFIPALPLLAIAGCLMNRGLGEHARAVAATASAVLSGFAAAEAILRVDWHIWGT